MSTFASDIERIRRQAREHMNEGAVTPGYKADPAEVVTVLNDVLATEIVCFLRYKRHYFMAQGINSESVKQEFLQHATEEQQHADMLAQRITQLNGEPNFDPKDLASRSHSEYADSTDLLEMLKEDLYAERIAIDSYSEVIRWLSDNDPTTRKLMEDILKVEEEHADDLKNLLAKTA
jgi:bacterioferritin